MSEVIELAAEANTYADFFGLAWTISARDINELVAKRDAMRAAKSA